MTGPSVSCRDGAQRVVSKKENTMILRDDVTFEEKLTPHCIACNGANLKPAQAPFFASDKALEVIIPLICEDCGYSFSIDLNIVPRRR